MIKKWFLVLMVAVMAFTTFTGCQKEEKPASDDVVVEEEVAEEEVQAEEPAAESTEEPAEEVDDAAVQENYKPDIDLVECSLCEVVKFCGTFAAEGEEYAVCDDCANEFATAFEDTVERHECGGCQEEQICGMYVVDGDAYFVCIDDYDEFAHGMGIE